MAQLFGHVHSVKGHAMLVDIPVNIKNTSIKTVQYVPSNGSHFDIT